MPETAFPGNLVEEEWVRWQVDFQEMNMLLPWPWATFPGTKVLQSSRSAGEGYRESSTGVHVGKGVMEHVRIAALPQKEEENQEIDEGERPQAAGRPCTNRRVLDDGKTKRGCC